MYNLQNKNTNKSLGDSLHNTINAIKLLPFNFIIEQLCNVKNNMVYSKHTIY